MHDRTERHVGVLGLSIDQAFRGQGLGRLLMETTTSEAIQTIAELRIIILKVKAPNAVAISLYEKLGFKAYARLPLGAQHRGEYVDELAMYKTIER